ncbi:MAG TPA: hypothetical protein VH934_09880 [Xanthobacteraceae bacterium]
MILLVGVAATLAFAGRAAAQEGVETATLERSASFEISPISGSLKETRQSGQQLVWLGKGGPDDRRFQITNISVAFLRSDAAGEVKMTFAGDISSFGYRPVDEARLNIIVRTRGGSSIYSWIAGISVRCTDSNRPITLSQEIPGDVAANVFNNVGAVEVAEYRQPDLPPVKVRRCPG